MLSCKKTNFSPPKKTSTPSPKNSNQHPAFVFVIHLCCGLLVQEKKKSNKTLDVMVVFCGVEMQDCK